MLLLFFLSRPGALFGDDEEGTRNVTEMSADTFTMTDMIMGGGILPGFEEKSCNANVCRNGGTCLSTLTGPKCHCPLQFSGRQCEEEVTVDVPGFVGNFFLKILFASLSEWMPSIGRKMGISRRILPPV